MRSLILVLRILIKNPFAVFLRHLEALRRTSSCRWRKLPGIALSRKNEFSSFLGLLEVNIFHQLREQLFLNLLISFKLRQLLVSLLIVLRCKVSRVSLRTRHSRWPSRYGRRYSRAPVLAPLFGLLPTFLFLLEYINHNLILFLMVQINSTI